MVKIKAVIMAGGEGTRLRPLTCALPKPMVPILNKPIMEYIIKLLKRNGIEEIAVTMAYLPNTIKDYFGDGSKWGVHLHYYIEETPLGTGGSVKNVEDFLDDTFLIISGDALTNFDVDKAIQYHKVKQSKVTLILKKEEYPLEYGVIVLDKDGKILRFLEKPNWGEVFSDTINTGIYILEPEVLKYYQRGEKFDFSKDLFPKLLKDQLPMYGYISDDYWCDIGDLKTYARAQFDILHGLLGAEDMHQGYREIQKGVWIGKEVTYHPQVKFHSPVWIGGKSIIENRTRIGPNVIIGEGCGIREGSSIKNSVIWKNSCLGKNVQVRGSIICKDVAIDSGANLYEQSVIGNHVRIHSGVTINPNIKVWPHKRIEENTMVNRHLVWGTKVKKTIFGQRDVSGMINIDITPEFASLFGSALANIAEDNRTFIVTSDLNKGSQLIKQAVITGILSAGRKVIDIGTGPLPEHRYAIDYYKAQGGIYISSNQTDRNKIHMEVMNEKGANINSNQEREIENLLSRGDFKRVSYEGVPRALYQQEFSTAYITKVLSFMGNIDKLRQKDISIIIASPSETILSLTSSILEIASYKVRKIQTTEDQRKHFAYIQEEMKKGRAFLGAYINEKGDGLVLFDEKGNQIQQEDYTLLSHLILFKRGHHKKIVVPHTFPEVIEELANKYEGEVIRTKSSPAQIMSEMLRIDQEEDENNLSFILQYDAICATAIITDFLVREGISLGELQEEIPRYYYRKEHIPCKWQDKGRVIRKMISKNDTKNLELFEGVKIKNHKGWAIVLPDSEKPLFNLYVQGNSQEYAKELATDVLERVTRLIDRNRK